MVIMLRVTNRKSLWKRKPYYSYSRAVKTPYFARQPKLRKTYLAMMFCILTLSFTFTFTSITEGDSMFSASKRVDTISSKGKSGVSRPQGTASTKKNSGTVTSGAPGSTATQAGATAATSDAPIPPKAVWTSKALYVDPWNGASQYAAQNPGVVGVNHIVRMGQTPVAQWFGDWNGNVTADANAYVSAAAAAGKVPVLVAYNIPNRDCGGYSVGGAGGVSVYTQWVQRLAAGIGGRTAVVILEPDALGALDCLPAAAQQDRLQSLASAVTILKALGQTSVYIDAGTPVWQPANVMAQRLTAANVAAADGFSLNVSYFATTADNRAYGNTLSKLIGNKHYVIDTSRNGGNNKPTGMQCNPSFASFGEAPTTNTGSAINDALLWIKIPWESDGPCNGSPGPGQEYWDYALLLAKNAGW